ncbi:hypothetical protein HHK36_012821 [Tetracentron sinense]|uniref:Uncharacterized protein n=1 Tax=Tetracentron sinense TaxID=13715 RepID=A0A834ZFZ4_TETSI|nr:hypothetical protein HHK36_012821 [Tetracentron sinense]
MDYWNKAIKEEIFIENPSINSKMDSSFIHSPTSQFQFSPESSFGSPESFSWEDLVFNDQFLPFNENDSEEMLLLDVIVGAARDPSETHSSTSTPIKEEEVSSIAKEEPKKKEKVEESLRDMMKHGLEEGCSPVVALKKRHSMKRKSNTRKKNKGREVRIENAVVFEDLGADFLEELLSSSEITSPW